MGLRWVRRQLMWRLRNRLIVTYVFIGVIPIVLLVMMGLLAGYLFAGQFATYVAMSDLQSELRHLESANRSLAMQFRSLARSEKLNEQLAAEISSASDENFRNRVVSVWDGDKPFVLSAGRPGSEASNRSTYRRQSRATSRGLCWTASGCTCAWSSTWKPAPIT